MGNPNSLVKDTQITQFIREVINEKTQDIIGCRFDEMVITESVLECVFETLQHFEDDKETEEIIARINNELETQLERFGYTDVQIATKKQKDFETFADPETDSYFEWVFTLKAKMMEDGNVYS